MRKVKIPAKLRTAWLKALRSGKYKQTEGTLYDTAGGFCCLGVLEHVALKGRVEIESPDENEFEDFRTMPSKIFLDHYGFSGGTSRDRLMGDLQQANDLEQKSFHEIADIIEERTVPK